ncbi:hypothetical protein [Noviherbaspirillum sedimenti]|uniref:Uncharacterized protein n=1 Tax=Noviherbaspirillum sedimenti TaxID=2320865 RepID=A0A3A3G254_9BURK|nr:hypothetical protein [Noviherbaspirillum sedimenti]RJG00562.1 hypothetical protein D3878_02380 [Noviherbaspirillum sedimenti]
MRLTILALLLLLTSFAAPGQSTAAQPPTEDLPLDAYLALLERIAPAARNGAETFLAASRQRCGRQLTVQELRQAVADGAGEPVLMAMMRASAQRDAALLQRLSNSVPCTGRR